MHFFSSLLLFQKQTKKQKNRKQKNRGAGEEDKKTRKKNREKHRAKKRSVAEKKKKFAERREACLRGGKEEKLLRSAPQRRAQTRETPANDNFLQFFSSSVLLQFFFSSSSSFKKVRLYCLVYLSFSLCFFRYRREMGNWRCLDQSRGRSCPLHGFLSLSHSDWGDDFYARARDICIDTYIDSIRCVRLILTNPLLSSPSSSSRAVLFFLGSPAVSPLSLSLSARRAYARAAGRYSEKAKFNPFCFCRGTKIVTFRHTDRVKKTNNSLTSSARASVRSLRKTTGTISPRVLLSSSSPESSIFCSSSSRARQTSRLGSFSLTRFARGRGERHLGILSLSLSLSLSRPNRTNERTNERAKEREREFSL